MKTVWAQRFVCIQTKPRA